MKNKILYIFIAGLSLFSSSCEDFLEIDKQGELTADTYYVNEEKAFELIVAMYHIYNMRWPVQFSRDMYIFTDMRTDDATIGYPDQHVTPPRIEIIEGNVLPTNDIVRNLWTWFYAAVGRANYVLDFVPDIPEEEFSSPEVKKAIIAEAKCFRAMMYTYIAKTWRDAPLITKTLNADNYLLKKSSQQEIFNQVYKDLMEASANLPRKAGTNAGRLTKAAAMYLWAQTLIFEAGTDPNFNNPKGTAGKSSNWEAAFLITDSIVNGPLSGDYKLLKAEDGYTYQDIWTEGFDFHPESIFEIVNTQPNNTSDYVQYFYARYTTNDAGERAPCYGYGGVAPLNDFIGEFEDNDPRLQASVWFEGDTVPIGSNPESGPKLVWLKDSRTGYYMKKYWLLSWPDDDQSPINPKEIRLADVILMHAEAAYYTGREVEARTSLNKIRERARQGNPGILPDITASGQALLEAIWQERRVEMCFEHQRSFDLIRQGKFKEAFENYGGVDGQGAPYRPGMEYMPIPQAEIDLNPNLVQNPDY